MLRTYPTWPVPVPAAAPSSPPASAASSPEQAGSQLPPPPVGGAEQPATASGGSAGAAAAEPRPSGSGETWVVTVAVNIRRDPSFKRRPIGSIDEGIPVRIRQRGYFNSLQWVQMQEPPAPHREAWVLIKNGAGTRFLRPATAEELHATADAVGDAAPRPSDATDPITMEPIGRHPFQVRRPDGSVIGYNPETLIDYILSSADFTCPVTRRPFSDEDLAALDALAQSTGLDRPSVLRAKQHPDVQRLHNDKFRRDALTGLDRCAGEAVTAMLNLVETSDDLEDAMMQLATDLFPQFADVFLQMKAADRPFAMQCLRHYTGFMTGPPNRRTRDRRGLLKVVLHFMQDFN